MWGHLVSKDPRCMGCGSVEEVSIFFVNLWLEVTTMRMANASYQLLVLCQLSFSSVQAVTISWFQSLFQQIIQDMKKGIRVTLEMEAGLLLKDFHILSLLSLEGSYTGQKMCLNTHC